MDKAKSHPFDPSHAIDMDDLAHLNNMHEAPLLHVLKRCVWRGGGPPIPSA